MVKNKANEIFLRYPGANAGVTAGDVAILFEAVDDLKPNSNYVELGVAHGFSLISIALRKPDINCYGIESIDREYPPKIIKEWDIKNAHFIKGLSEEVCKKWDKEIDVLFIDATHNWPNIFWDVIGWLPYVKKGGTILFHDACEPEQFDVAEAIKVFRGHQYYNFRLPKEEGISSGIAVITKP